MGFLHVRLTHALFNGWLLMPNHHTEFVEAGVLFSELVIYTQKSPDAIYKKKILYLLDRPSLT